MTALSESADLPERVDTDLPLTWPVERTRPDVDYRLTHLVLDVERSDRLDLHIENSITDAQLELTIDGASTLTLQVEDPHRDLLHGNLLSDWTWGNSDDRSAGTWVARGRHIDARLDDIVFRLVKVSKQAESQIQLVFEERDVARLRGPHKAKKAYRDKVTRAEFVKSLVREIHHPDIPFYCPELHKREPIEHAGQKVTKKARRTTAHPGINPRQGGLTVKGAHPSPTQFRIVERCLDVAYHLHAPTKAMVALVEALIQENDVSNAASGGGGSVGILQLLPSWGPLSYRLNIEKVTHQFLTSGFYGKGGAIHLAKTQPSWNPGQIAQAVQGSAFPLAYEHWRHEADRWVQAYHGGGGDSGTVTTTRVLRYAFERKKNESSWDAIGRLAGEVGWRRFMRQGSLWFISERDLFAQRAELVVAEHQHSVESIDFDIDIGARRGVAEATITAHSARWTALPGMVVHLENMGPAEGRWLVDTVSRSLVDDSGLCTIHVRKPIPEKKEPAPQTVTTTKRIGGGSGPSVGKGAHGIPDPVYRMLQAARRIHARAYPYVLGGGHGSFNGPYDCSGAVSAVLHAGGLLNTPEATGPLASWGIAGSGRYFTVYVHNGGPAGGHTFIVFTLPGREPVHFGTGHTRPGGGAGFQSYMHTTVGFAARHSRGL